MDYKVVLIFKYYTAGIAAGTVVLEMYSLKTNSWKSKAVTYNNNSHKDFRINKYWCGVVSNGILSWKASSKGNGDIQCTNEIISVDLSNDSIITTTPLPSSISHKHPPSDYRNNYCLDYKDSLALVHSYNQARKKSFDIWVLGEYGVKESWNKLFTIGPFREIGRVLGFYDDGKGKMSKGRDMEVTKTGNKGTQFVQSTCENHERAVKFADIDYSSMGMGKLVRLNLQVRT
nr:uncharacterized protein LOC107411740 [Ziziphus jujuba var. spinosa]